MGKTNLKRLISSSTTTIVLLLVYGIGLPPLLLKSIKEVR